MPSFKYSMIQEGMKRFYFDGLNNKMFMDSNNKEIKPYGKVEVSDKGRSSLRPMNFNPSNTSKEPSAKALDLQKRNTDILKYKEN